MANRFPLILDSNNNKIKELPSGDNLDLSGVGISSVSTISVGTAVTIGSYGIHVTGVITATTFSGSLTGNVSGNADTATNALGLTGTPNITVDTITGDSANFSGNVSVGGTLTYQDVSHIDSVGIITAQQGIQVLANGVDVTGVSTFSSKIKVGSATTIFGHGAHVTGIVSTTSLGLDAGLVSSQTTITSNNSQTSIDSFSSTNFRSAKYQIQITSGSDYHTTELSVIHDGSSTYNTEYGTIVTGSSLATFTTDILSNNVRLLATPAAAGETTFKLVRILIRV